MLARVGGANRLIIRGHQGCDAGGRGPGRTEEVPDSAGEGGGKSWNTSGWKGQLRVAWRRVWALFQAEGTACAKSPPIGPLLSHHWLVEEAARSSVHYSLLRRPPQPLIPHQAAKFQRPAEGSPPTTAGCIPSQVPQYQ